MEGDIPAQLQHRCEQLDHIAKGTAAGSGGDDTSPNLGLDCLMDTFVALFDECQQDSLSRNKNIAAFLRKCKKVRNCHEWVFMCVCPVAWLLLMLGVNE